MKRASHKKDHVVVRFDEYDRTWRDITVPCTYLQAIRYVTTHKFMPLIDNGGMAIVHMSEFIELTRPKE